MRRFVHLVVAASLAVAACGGDSVAVTEAPADGGDPAPTSTAAPASTTTTEAPAESATLADYLPMFGFAGGDEAEVRAFYTDQENRAQEYARDCMAEQGFEYIPYVPSYEDEFFADDFDEAEWAAQYGFGMAYWLLEEESLYPEEEWDPYDDPNYAITEAMSEAEQEAYYYALYGEEVDEEAIWAGIDWETASEEEIAEAEARSMEAWQNREWKGCMELGWTEASGGGDDIWMSFEDEFGSMWDEIDAQMQADPRIIALETEWQSCMAGAGYDYRDQEEMYREFESEFERIVTWPGEEDDPTGTTLAPFFDVIEQDDGTVIYVDEFGNELTEEQVDAMWAPAFDETDLRAFLDREIAVAVANARCNEGRWEAWDEIWQEYTTRWVGDNKAALDSWKAGRDD